MPGPLIPSLMREDEPKRRATHTAPRRHEKRVAKVLGGLVTPASGAVAGNKGDVKGVRAWLFDFLVECKTTCGNRLPLQAVWLAKVTSEAGPLRIPALAIRFEADVMARLSQKYGVDTEQDWVMIPLSAFQKMQRELGDTDAEV